MEIIKLENLNKSELHDLFEEYFPAPYGRNLDALHDCLSMVNHPLTIHVDEDSLLSKLEERYYESLLRMLRATAEENPNLTVIV